MEIKIPVELKPHFEQKIAELKSKPYSLDFKKRMEIDKWIDLYERKLKKLNKQHKGE